MNLTMTKIKIKPIVFWLSCTALLIAGLLVNSEFARTRQANDFAMTETSAAPSDRTELAKSINHKLYQQPTNLSVADLPTPESLKGVDYALAHLVDEQGQLIPSQSIRSMFDSYLSTLNESDLENTIKLIQAEINDAFAEPARTEALSLLKRYLDYKIELADFELSNLALNDLNEFEQIRQNLSALQELRTSYFTDQEYDGFFSEEDAHNAFVLEQMRINQDPTLSPEEKSSRLNHALNLLPEAHIQSRKKMLEHTQLIAKVDYIRENGGTEDEIFSAREQVFGAQAAIEMKALDERRFEWQTRLKHFSNGRNSILESSMSESDKETAIYALISDQFEPGEHKRVIALMNDGRLN